MPRRKLDIDKTFAALSHKAANPQDDIVIIEPEPEKVKRKFSYGYDGHDTPSNKPLSKMEEVILHCAHSIGSAGLNGGDGVVHQYGPGRCMVPRELAATLLHQDQVAKAVDERVFDTRQRMYQIAPLRQLNGGTVYRGVPVESLDFHTMFYGNTNMHFQF